MAKGYWIGHVEVTDPEGYKKYIAANAVASCRQRRSEIAPRGDRVP